MVAALVGGAAGLGVAGLVGPRAAFVTSGVVYGVASAIAASIREPMVHPQARAGDLAAELARVGRELGSGTVEVWRRQRARLPLLGIFILRITAVFVAIAAILVIKREFPEAGDRFGRLSSSAIALGAAGVGALVGAVAAPYLGRRFGKPRLLLLGFGISAAAMTVGGAMINLPVIVGMTLVGGFGAFVAKVSVDAQVQEALPDGFRGRAFALYDLLYNLASIVAAAVMVFFATASLQTPLIAMGLTTLAFGLGLGSAMRKTGVLTTPPGSAKSVRYE